jgi:hypothetical protein
MLVVVHGRCKVVQRRAQFDLNKASKRLHLVEGFLAAMCDLDNVVSIIRKAPDAAMAAAQLQSTLGLSTEQAEGVLGLTLRRLTSLENGKLVDEQKVLQTRQVDRSELRQMADRKPGPAEQGCLILFIFSSKHRSSTYILIKLDAGLMIFLVCCKVMTVCSKLSRRRPTRSQPSMAGRGARQL